MNNQNASLLPKHVAVIMDGNGRWASQRGLELIEGHRKGAEAAKTIVRQCLSLGIPYLTLYAFSLENWHRPTDWVANLMHLLREYLTDDVSELFQDKVRLRIVGDKSKLPEDIQTLIAALENKTKDHTQLHLQIALSYSGRAEIVQAVQRICQKVAEKTIEAETVDDQLILDHLYTTDIPDPDILIRTSGEHRLSNFLLWQIAYSELVFMDTLWPDFTETHFCEALDIYAKRDRRFGQSFGTAA